MKSKFNIVFEEIMNSFDPAMGDNLFEHLVLVNVLDYLKNNFPEAEIEINKEDPTDVYCNVLFDNGTIYLLFDKDNGKVYIGCEELNFFESQDVKGVLDLFEEKLYDKMYKLKEALENLD